MHENGMHDPISVSKDGKYSIEFVECLASCGTAPVCMVQDDLIENVKPEAVSDSSYRSPITDHRSPSLRPTRSSIASSSRTSDALIGRPTSTATCATAATNN